MLQLVCDIEKRKIWAHDTSIHTCIYKNCGERVVAYLSQKRQTIGIIPIRIEIARRLQKKRLLHRHQIASVHSVSLVHSMERPHHIHLNVDIAKATKRTNEQCKCMHSKICIRSKHTTLMRMTSKKKKKRNGEKSNRQLDRAEQRGEPEELQKKNNYNLRSKNPKCT